MTEIYYYIGFSIFWVFAISFTCAIFYYLYIIIYGFFKFKVYQSDWFSFYILRRTLPTELMIKYYSKTNGRAKKYTHLFRLRNIKKARK